MNVTLSKTAREAKNIFLRKNPDRWPTDTLMLDDFLMLLDIYFKFYLEEKRKDFESFLKNNKELNKLKSEL